MGKIKYNTDIVKNIFIEKGCQLLSNYVSTKEKMDYICNCGNQSEIRLSDFLRGARCKQCGFKKISNKKSIDIDHIRKVLENNNCELLFTFYNENKIKLIKFKCWCGNTWQKHFTDFVDYPHCKECGIKKIIKSRRREDREKVKLEKKLSDYICCRLHRLWNGEKARKKTIEKFGYGSEELIDHIKNHPNYESRKENFQFDHIFPVSAFTKNNIYDLKIINNLTNLQPLTKLENCLKGSVYNQQEFELWLQSIGYQLEKSNE